MSSLEGLPALNRRLNAISQGRDLLRTVQIDAVAEAKKLVEPFSKTRNLSRSIAPGSLSDTNALVVATAPYAGYVEKGTGLYGPKKKKIVPKKAKLLAWRVGETRLSGRSRTKGGKELAGWAYAKSVKGRKATPYLVPGAQKAIAGTGLKLDLIDRWNKAA